MSVLYQIVATVLICFSCMNMGIFNGFPSSTILTFKSENTTLDRPMTNTEVALFSSLPAIGCLVVNPLAAMLLDRIGRKSIALLASMMFVIAWSLITLNTKVEVILTAMFISGLGCAVFLDATIFISEISQDSIRGTLTAGPNQAYGFGFLVSYLLGGTMGYYEMVYTCLGLAVLGVLMITILSESPLNLMARGKETEAAKSLAFYRRTNTTAKEVIAELNNIRRILHSNSEDVLSLSNDDKFEVQQQIKKQSCWQFFKSNSPTRREFYLVIVLKIAYICQGLPVVQVYAEPMFAAAVGDVISPNLCSVVLGLVVLVAGLVAAYLTDVLGRRPLQIYSSICAGVCCLVLGLQLIMKVFPKWTVPLFIYAYATFHTVGAGTVPFVILAEVFLPEVKSILTMLAIEWAWLSYFLILFLFNLLIHSVGLSPVFFFFSFICFCTSIYFFYFLPETKGLPVYAIQELFKKKMKT